MRTHPPVFATRALAEDELWALANDGRADLVCDRRYLALVLWPRSRACAGANSLLCAGPTSTSPPRRSVSAMPSWSDLPARSGAGHAIAEAIDRQFRSEHGDYEDDEGSSAALVPAS